MQAADILAFCRRQRYGVVASTASDGRPQAAVVGVAFSERGEVVFDTLGSARKARNLRRDPRAALVMWEGERTVQLEGEVDEPSGAERERLFAVYFAAFPDGRARLQWPGITHFRITPFWVRYSDFDARPEPLIVERTALVP
jgi:Pyridoxamine 5'-phosphate oxidase